MSYVSADIHVNIEMVDFEKDHLIQTYGILNNLVSDMWNDDLEETSEYYKIECARDSLKRVLEECLGIDVDHC